MKDKKQNTHLIAELLEDIGDFDKILTDRIAEAHDVKGMQESRHAFLYYRSLLWAIRDKLELL